MVLFTDSCQRQSRLAVVPCAQLKYIDIKTTCVYISESKLSTKTPLAMIGEPMIRTFVFFLLARNCAELWYQRCAVVTKREKYSVLLESNVENEADIPDVGSG